MGKGPVHGKDAGTGKVAGGTDEYSVARPVANAHLSQGASTMISSETIENYLGRLASGRPTPGGGAAAALHAAQGAALVAMVARFTTGGRYEQHRDLVTHTISAADSLIVEALRFADADEHAFKVVIDSYKLPSNTAEEREGRATAIRDALVRAADPPIALIGLAAAVVKLAADLMEVANSNVISDVAAAADAARAAAATARINIDINVVAIKDPETRKTLTSRTDGLAEKVILAAESLSNAVRARILG